MRTGMSDWAYALEVNRRGGGSFTVDYKGMGVLIPLAHLVAAIDELRPLWFWQRWKVMREVKEHMDEHFPVVRAGEASEETAVEFAYDLTIEIADKIIRGKMAFPKEILEIPADLA